MADTEETTVDESTCPGPDGEPIPLLHFDDATGPGKLAVSFARGHAVFSTAASPRDMLTAYAVMLAPADRRELGRRLLAEES